MSGSCFFSSYQNLRDKIVVAMVRFVFLLCICLMCETLALVAQRSNKEAWQAGLPMNVNIEYEVPNMGLQDEIVMLQQKSGEQASMAQKQFGKLHAQSQG